jgi:hypothetical protein
MNFSSNQAPIFELPNPLGRSVEKKKKNQKTSWKKLVIRVLGSGYRFEVFKYPVITG